MGRPLRIVCYGVNGAGVGHVTRLVAIARWLRRYTTALGEPAEIWFLTSSEATKLLFDERFAAFKLPSKTSVADAGIDKLAYLALAKQWVWHSLGLLRPDLLLVDTFPRGAFGELLGALDLAQKRAFVYRPTKADFAARADFQAMLPLYDALLVPEHEEHAEVLVPDAARELVRYVGPIAVREREELRAREEARRLLGVDPDAGPVVYVTAGGGGDPTAAARLELACDAVAAWPEATIVVGAGPLYRGAPRRGPRTVWLEGGNVAEVARAFDVAICAAGYNTFAELMLAGVPCVFWPQPKVADDQHARARRAERAGAGVVLPGEPSAAELLDAVRALTEPAAAGRAREAASRLVPRSHARDAAEALLRLVQPRADVDLAVRRASIRALRLEHRIGADLGVVAQVDLALAGREGPAGVEGPQGATTDLALELLERGAELGFTPALTTRVVVPFARKLPQARPRERAAATGELLAALAAFGDPQAAVPFVRVLATERQLPAARLVDALRIFLVDLKKTGADLHEGALLLSRASTAGGEQATNQELLERAREGWA